MGDRPKEHWEWFRDIWLRLWDVKGSLDTSDFDITRSTIPISSINYGYDTLGDFSTVSYYSSSGLEYNLVFTYSGRTLQTVERT